jgi:hypothetical protein
MYPARNRLPFPLLTVLTLAAAVAHLLMVSAGHQEANVSIASSADCAACGRVKAVAVRIAAVKNTVIARMITLLFAVAHCGAGRVSRSIEIPILPRIGSFLLDVFSRIAFVLHHVLFLADDVSFCPPLLL